MRRIAFILIGLGFVSPSLAQQAATQPAVVDVVPSAPAELGKLFRSRLAGIEFNPPAGGTLMRELLSGEVARFLYADLGWDLRVKQIPAHVDLKLSSPDGDGVLELTTTQFTNSNPSAKILRQEVIKVNDKHVGIIEARYNVGTDPIFAQQAIFCDNPRHFLLLQMSSRRDPKAAGDQPDRLEIAARETFARILLTVKLLDRSALFEEQMNRQYKTANLWVLLNEKKVTSAIIPLHFMRVVRDGKDIGFIQMNERLSSRNGKPGIEVIVRSRVVNDPSNSMAKSTDTKPDATGAAVVVQAPIVAANPPAVKDQKPSNLYTNSTFFVTFDRIHEDWTAINQTDESAQFIETGYSDQSTRMAGQLERAELRREEQSKVSHAKPSTQPIDVRIPVYSLDVTYDEAHVGANGAPHRQTGKPADFELPPYYMPQALSQILPRLLPDDPAQYMFAFYVGNERKVMNRYVDVEAARDVDIDGRTIRAVPISDRIGVDGIPTVHYVSRDGEWLGSINDDQKLQVLPTDEKTLHSIWDSQPLGFKVAPEPPPGNDEFVPDEPSDNHPTKPKPGSLDGFDLNGR